MKIISSNNVNIVDEEVTRVLKDSFNNDINELWIGDNQRMVIILKSDSFRVKMG